MNAAFLLSMEQVEGDVFSLSQVVIAVQIELLVLVCR